MNRRFLCLAAALLCGTGSISAPQPPQVQQKEVAGGKEFKVTTELMEVRAVVTDPQDRAIENLKLEDFELLEEGQLQKISFFSISRVESEPGESPGSKVEDADTAPTPRRLQERLGDAPVRTTLLFVDNLHLSFASLNAVKTTLRRFIDERMSDQDMVALATSSGTLGLAQQFTRNKQLLRYAIEQMRFGPTAHSSFYTPGLAARVINEGAGAGTAGGDGSFLAAERTRLRNEAAASGVELGRMTPVLATSAGAIRLAVDIVRRETGVYCPCSYVRELARNKAMQILSQSSYTRKNTLAILRGFSEQMTDLPGKRMIVMFSDGFTMYDSSGDLRNVEVQEAVHRAVRSGVVIYSIDAKGLQVPLTIDASRNAAGAYADCGEDPVDPACLPPDSETLAAYVNDAEREQLNGLHSVAQDTGGKMFAGMNNLGDALRQAFDANRFHYVLSYYLPSGSGIGKYRSIKVRIRNHPEYTVRAARGFFKGERVESAAEKAKTPQQLLFQAMNRPLPVSGLQISAQADYLEREGDDKAVTLSVYFEGDRFQYHEQDQRNVVQLELLYAIYDAAGKQVDAVSAQVEGRLTSERLTQAKSRGYRFSQRLVLKPGVYQVRVGVREDGSDRVGTASTWVEVPDLAPAALEMSSLMLRNPLDVDPAASEGIDVGKLEQVRMVQGVPLYARGDFCDYSFRVYEAPQSSSRFELALMKEVLRDGKPVKQAEWKPIPAEDKDKDGKGWFDLDGDVELSDFTPGVYELRISIKNTASNSIVQRTAVFGIE
jgi:VWFA-related protein